MAGHLPGRGFESLPESLSFFPLFIFSSLFLTFLSDFDLGLRSDCQVWSMLKIWASAPRASHPPPHVHLTSTRRHSVFPGLPRFSRSSASVYYTERKPKNKKTGKAWERGYPNPTLSQGKGYFVGCANSAAQIFEHVNDYMLLMYHSFIG